MASKKTIYLCGPINGCTDNEATNWRDIIKYRYPQYNYLDPMRRDYRGKEKESVTAIVEGDLQDIKDSDIIIANCWQPSFGTSMELAYAYYTTEKTIICIVPDIDKVSPWLEYHAFLTGSIDQAMQIIAHMIKDENTVYGQSLPDYIPDIAI